MYNKEEYQALILSALLHDIGKFYQRTGAELSDEDRRLMPNCCPNYQGNYSHFHVLYSGHFIREIFNNRIPLIENIVLYHHLPQSAEAKYRKLVKILTLADWLSSGERRDREEDAEKTDVSKEPLISVFSTLFADINSVSHKYIPLRPLCFDLAPLFPKDNKSDAINNNSYPLFWKKFTDEIRLLKNETDLNKLIIQIQFVLEKFTFPVPSSAYVDRPDISLYHHLKTTAGISACLYNLELEEGDIEEVLNAIKDGNDTVLKNSPCILLAGDISGIQDFIYSITSEQALKSIKGRSFYLQLISESIAKSILNLFNLPLCNIIYIGGGNLYILLPNTSKVKSEVEDFKNLMNKNFLYAHRGKLSVNIAYEELKYADFLGKNFGEVWGRLKQHLAREKQKKFSTVLNDATTINLLLGPYDIGGEKSVCAVCGEEIEQGNICELCDSFATLAYDQSRARYIQEIFKKPKEIKEAVKNWNSLLEAIGTEYKLWRDPPQGENTYLVNKVDFLSENFNYNGFYFIAQNAPRLGEQIKTLEDIANESEGIKKWGVLRADVDNIGKVFKEGLGDEDRTISRLAMLSEMLGMFFKVQVEKIAQETKYKDKIYVIYSGGDDLFVIGPWASLPDFTMRLYQDFRKYAANNLTFSAAISIAPTKKYPVYQSAEQGKEELELAKQNGKNKITFLGIPVPWDRMNSLKEMKDKIVFLLAAEGANLPRSLLQILNFGWVEARRFKKGEVPMQRIWRFLYAMKRLKVRCKEEYSAVLDELEKAVIIDEQKVFRDYLEVPVRWAELLTRKEVKNESL